MNGFSRWWAGYPHRVGKLAAERAFTKALKRATVEELIAGVERYKATKPSTYAWAYPASWLNAGRWMDEVEPPTVYTPWHCPHVEPCANRGHCRINSQLGRPEKVAS